MSASQKRAAAPPRTAARQSNYGKPSGSGSGAQPENAMGAHAILQPRAERNAKILLGLWMDHGRIPALDLPTDNFPTEPLAMLADRITDALARGRRSWPEVFEDTADKAVLECDEALREHEEKHGKTNVAALRKELNEFHNVKARQLALWRCQAALDKGEDTAPSSAELSALDAEAVDSGSLLARAYALRYDPSAQPPADEVCLSIEDIPIAARGNLTALQGKSKVGKSAVVSAILASSQRGQFALQGDTICIGWNGEAEGAIIHLDTEQSPADWHGLVSRSVTRSGLPQVSERLVSLPLVMFARSERMEILEQALKHELETKGKVDLVVIDGIADLCKSPNDEEEALEVISRLMAMAHRYAVAMVCILHENPGTDAGKTRGHLGSELNRKAFANLRIDKDGETSVSTLYGTDMRKREIPRDCGFCFAWDDGAGMHTFKGRAAGLKAAHAEEKKITKERAMFEPLWELADSGTNGVVPELSAKQLHELERDSDGTKKPASEGTWKKRMQRAEALGLLRKTSEGKWKLNPSGQAGQ